MAWNGAELRRSGRFERPQVVVSGGREAASRQKGHFGGRFQWPRKSLIFSIVSVPMMAAGEVAAVAGQTVAVWSRCTAIG